MSVGCRHVYEAILSQTSHGRLYTQNISILEGMNVYQGEKNPQQSWISCNVNDYSMHPRLA